MQPLQTPTDATSCQKPLATYARRHAARHHLPQVEAKLMPALGLEIAQTELVHKKFEGGQGLEIFYDSVAFTNAQQSSMFGWFHQY